MENQSRLLRLYWPVVLVALALYAGYVLGQAVAWKTQTTDISGWCQAHVGEITRPNETPMWKVVYGQVVPYILSAISVYMTILAGNMNPKAWLFGLAAQVGWLSWILVTQIWGFLILNIAMWVVYTRNHLNWNKNKGHP
jgi:membrane protein DedA with SNARE-associated domain